MSGEGDDRFVLVELAIELLASGGAGEEPILIADTARAALAAAIELIMLAGVGVPEELGSLLRLARVLETSMNSPAAAGELYAALEEDPRVFAALGVARSPKIWRPELAHVAPAHEAEPQPGTMKLFTLLNERGGPTR